MRWIKVIDLGFVCRALFHVFGIFYLSWFKKFLWAIAKFAYFRSLEIWHFLQCYKRDFGFFFFGFDNEVLWNALKFDFEHPRQNIGLQRNKIVFGNSGTRHCVHVFRLPVGIENPTFFVQNSKGYLSLFRIFCSDVLCNTIKLPFDYSAKHRFPKIKLQSGMGNPTFFVKNSISHKSFHTKVLCKAVKLSFELLGKTSISKGKTVFGSRIHAMLSSCSLKQYGLPSKIRYWAE